MITITTLDPQPVKENGVWFYEGESFLSNDSLQSHLFHNVYGKTGSPYGSVYADGTTDKYQGMRLLDVNIELLVGGWSWVVELEKVS